MPSHSATATTTATTSGESGISDAQKIANLRTATHLVANQLSVNTLAMTYEDRLKFNRALAVVITTYPTRFSSQSVINAQATLNKNNTPLEDTGFDLSMFGSAFADNALVIGKKIADAAQNGVDAVGNTFSLLKFALPLLVVGGLGFVIYLKAKSA